MLPSVLVRARGRALVQRLLVPLRARPNFLVIGAQKSGTTSLQRYLAQHPAVLCATPKEVHYLDLARHHAYGDGWYLSHFPLRWRARSARRAVGEAPAIGEVTPDYLFHPWAAERAHAFDPGLRLLAVLRDPVERAYSQYQMRVRKYGEALTFEEALDREARELPEELARMVADPGYTWPHDRRRSYVGRGLYAEQLERWLRFFPRDQLLVLTSDELWADTEPTLRRIERFLGIPEWHGPYPHQSGGSYEPMAPATRERLALTFEEPNRRLAELLGRELPWTRPAAEAPVLEPSLTA